MSRSYIYLLRSGLVGLLVISLISGCSKIPKLDAVLPDKRTEYKRSKSLPDLEVPPDLATDAIKDRMAVPNIDGETATFSTYQERVAERKREAEVEKAQTSAIRLLENEHVVAVEGALVQIWPKLREFWEDRGYTLDLDDEELGVIETDWYENQQELTRDRFKIFAEPGDDAGTTLLYISHRGEELVPKGESLVWQPRPRDVELERRLVERLNEHVTGRPSAVADTATDGAGTRRFDRLSADAMDNARAELISVGEGKVYLTVQEDFPSTWKITGAALDRVGVSIDQADKARGVYYIRFAVGDRQQGKKGVWSKLKFWDREGDEIHQLSLTGVGDKTEVVVLDKDGKWETSAEAGQLLSRLHDEFNQGQI